MAAPTPKKQTLHGVPVRLRSKEANALQRQLTKHRGGYDAYVKARESGRNREPHRHAYSAYKRAYRRWLELRHSALQKAGQ